MCMSRRIASLFPSLLNRFPEQKMGPSLASGAVTGQSVEFESRALTLWAVYVLPPWPSLLQR